MTESSGPLEYRELRVAGNLPREQWDALYEKLGGLSLYVESTQSDAPGQRMIAEAEPVPRYVSREDFLQFAETVGEASRRQGGRAWGILTRHYTDKLLERGWKDNPLVFQTVPDIELYGLQWCRDRMDGLDVGSLAAFLQVLEERITTSSQAKEDEVIREMLGSNVSVPAVRLLREFVRAKVRSA